MQGCGGCGRPSAPSACVETGACNLCGARVDGDTDRGFCAVERQNPLQRFFSFVHLLVRGWPFAQPPPVRRAGGGDAGPARGASGVGGAAGGACARRSRRVARWARSDGARAGCRQEGRRTPGQSCAPRAAACVSSCGCGGGAAAAGAGAGATSAATAAAAAAAATAGLREGLL